jgi:hypothetical protein
MVSFPLVKWNKPLNSTQTAPTADQADLFPSAIKAAQSIYGMLSDFSIAVMDMVLSLQTRSHISGHIVEIGVFKGKSAAVLSTHAAGNERLILVDAFDQFERDKLTAIKPDTEFIICPSEQLQSTSGYRALKGKCRFIHIDASHQFEATQRELAIADELMIDNGIVVLDDFANLNYSQNIAAIYKYLFTANTQLTPFLVTNDKGYLCRKRHFDFYGSSVLASAVDSMALRGVTAGLARTDSHPEYRAFYLRERWLDEANGLYGAELYKQFYVKA